MTSHHILFVKSKSVSATHTQVEGITQGMSPRRWGSLPTFFMVFPLKNLDQIREGSFEGIWVILLWNRCLKPDQCPWAESLGILSFCYLGVNSLSFESLTALPQALCQISFRLSRPILGDLFLSVYRTSPPVMSFYRIKIVAKVNIPGPPLRQQEMRGEGKAVRSGHSSESNR